MEQFLEIHPPFVSQDKSSKVLRTAELWFYECNRLRWAAKILYDTERLLAQAEEIVNPSVEMEKSRYTCQPVKSLLCPWSGPQGAAVSRALQVTPSAVFRS